MRLVALALALAACRPAPVLNPDKEKNRRYDVERENEMATAPGGTVTTIDGDALELATLWAERPAVIIFYRGHWCPHCQRQLGELEKRQGDFKSAGATLVAISSDEPENLTAMRDKLALSYPLYSDAQLEVITKWGVADFKAGIAKPATFIVIPDGSIVFKKIGEKPEDRPSVDEIIAAIPQ